ncbi:MAG TPA: hypothetical protein VF894_06665 [Anaeromyxobacter sp.]
MIRLALKLAFAAAALWAVWTFVPVRGRTLAERWHAAAGPADFLERGIAEATGAAAGKAAAKPQARQKPAVAQRPTEAHTDADRRAVERILADRLDEKR